MLELNNMPLSIVNRALELYGADAESTMPAALASLRSVEGRVGIDRDGAPLFGLAPMARAIAEYMSLTGPWNQEIGEYADESGYLILP